MVIQESKLIHIFHLYLENVKIKVLIFLILQTYYDNDNSTYTRHLLECQEALYSTRQLAEAYGSDPSSKSKLLLGRHDIPMGIITFSYVFNIAFGFVRKLFLASEKDIRNRFVPNNLDYIIHRYGEWLMYVKEKKNNATIQLV